ncbi:hypothetical protein [Propionibacterium freudenreichii]|uniref:hypothetical protein n=1 Tax=Propionibacterium freudenreichii TaxID=1744 RepID=UPI00254F0C9B|nr:hypothetical protein [Propionibacterium freudenreichii]MDK9627006.1 hypothetical protein [Propionibacterium freudenreichii]
MTTWDYGFAPADVVTDSAGDVRPGIELRVWDAEVAGKAIAVQQDRGDGWKPVPRVLTDDVGRYRFRAEVGPTVWVEDASGRRWRQDAWQTLGTMIDDALTATAAAAAAAKDSAQAVADSAQALTTATSAATIAADAKTSAAASAQSAALSAQTTAGVKIAADLGNGWWIAENSDPPTRAGNQAAVAEYGADTTQLFPALPVGARWWNATTATLWVLTALGALTSDGAVQTQQLTWTQTATQATLAAVSPTAATETALLQMPATLGAIGLVTTTGARWMRRASGWVAETGPWTSTVSWTWGNGFHPAAPWNHLPTVMYRLVDFGRRVQMRGLIARDSGSGMIEMVSVPAELRPTSPYQPSMQEAWIVADGGNIKSEVGVTTAEWLSLEWEVG